MTAEKPPISLHGYQNNRGLIFASNNSILSGRWQRLAKGASPCDGRGFVRVVYTISGGHYGWIQFKRASHGKTDLSTGG